MPTIGKGPKSLMTEDPYHTPGYGGHCAQYKYQHGDTFGRITHKLLKDPKIARSDNSVLADVRLPALSRSVSLVGGGERRNVQERDNTDGSLKLTDDIIPGYSGFIPCREPYIGSRYTLEAASAVANFRMESKRLLTKRRDLTQHCERPLSWSVDTGRYQRPLVAIKANKSKPYVSKHQFEHAKSPYAMSNDDPDKKFLSGYAGFLPKYRATLGSGYPRLTHEALVEFSNYLAHKATMRTQPIDLTNPDTGAPRDKPSSCTIYPRDGGLIPRYTGHVPGEQFKNGATFAVTTTNARQLPVTI